MKKIFRVLMLLICFFLLSRQVLMASPVNWKKLESAHFAVLYEKVSEGRKILDEAESAYPRITSDFDYYPVKKINIYVFHSNSHFLDTSPSGVTRAYSQPFMNRIYVNYTQESVENAVSHEITHIVFLQSLPDSSRVPFWFVEGIAIYESPLEAKSAAIESHVPQGRIDSISDLSRKKPKSMDEQRRIATAGYMVISFISDKYGKDGLKALIRNLQRGIDFSIALEKSLGVPEEKLNEAWSGYAQDRLRQAYIQNLKNFGIFVLGLLVVAASGVWLAKRRREQRQLEQMVEEEELKTGHPFS